VFQFIQVLKPTSEAIILSDGHRLDEAVHFLILIRVYGFNKVLYVVSLGAKNPATEGWFNSNQCVVV
jgi:hypothetical protein